MRLLLVTHFHSGDVPGGTQTYVGALAAERARRGDAVRLVCGASEMHDGSDRLVGRDVALEVLRLPRHLPVEAHSGDLGSARLRDLVVDAAREHGADLVHVHHWHGLSNDLVSALDTAGFAVVVTLHDFFITCARHHRMPDARNFCAPSVTIDDCARCLADDLAPLTHDAITAGLTSRRSTFERELAAARRVLAVSEAQVSMLRSMPGYALPHIDVLPIGIEGNDALPPRPRRDPSRLRIVNWAGLDPRKGAELLVAAVAGSARRDRFSLRFRGRDGEPDFMAKLARLGAGLDLQFTGAFADGDRRRFAAESDLAVFPFLAFETYGLVVDEALHLGLPVVVSDRGAPPERVGAQGLVVRAGDVAHLRSVLESLLDDPQELERLAAGSHGARPLDSHFDRLDAIYREVLKSP